MTMFNRQPSLPAASAPGLNRDPHRRPSAPPRQAEPLGHFAVVGLDQQTHETVSTVIQARSEDDAQRIAQQQGLIIHEFKPMHPLAGAAALQLARSDPYDRFNLPSHLETPPADPHRRAASPAAATSGRALMQDTEFSPRPGTQARSPLGTFGVLTVLAVVGGVFYFTAVRDGGFRDTLVSLLPGPDAARAQAIDVDQPLGVNLAEVQGFEDWQYVNDLPSTASTNSNAIAPAPPRKLRLEATIPATRAAGGHRGSAVIGGQIIRPGQEIAGYRLVLVRDQHVLLQHGNKLIALRMSKDPAADAETQTQLNQIKTDSFALVGGPSHPIPKQF